MNDTIGFDIGKAEKSETAIRKQLDRLDALMEKLRKAVDDTSSWWEGGSRDAFMRRANAFLAKKSNIAYVITSLADNMATTIRFKKEQENEAAEIISNAGESPPGGVISVIQDIVNFVPDMIYEFFESIPGIIESNEEKRIMQTGWYITAEAAAAGALGIWKDPATGKWQLYVKDDTNNRIITRDVSDIVEIGSDFVGLSYGDKVYRYYQFLRDRASQPRTPENVPSNEMTAILTLLLFSAMTDSELSRFVDEHPEIAKMPEIAAISNPRLELMLEKVVGSLRDCGMNPADATTVYNWEKITAWLNTDPNILTQQQISALAMTYREMISLEDTERFRALTRKYDYKEVMPWVAQRKNYTALLESYGIHGIIIDLANEVIINDKLLDVKAKFLLSAIKHGDSVFSNYDSEENITGNKALTNITWPILSQNDEKYFQDGTLDINDPSTQVTMVKMGRKYASSNGCGWIATGNILHLMGNEMDPWEIVNYYDTTGGALISGEAGVNPEAIISFFNSKNISANIDYFPNYIDEQIRNSGIAIFNYLHDSAAHYIAVEYKDGEYVIYNEIAQNMEMARTSITAWIESNGWMPISIITFG